jgi:hypothetical protein
MRDLRLIGVHEDGQHLLLSDSDGERYRVGLDEQLRVAARRDRARFGQLQIELDGGMRPREVQALIRAGLSAEEVADRAGWTVEKVRRYEGPILAEREHVAGLAQGVRLRGSAGSSGGATTLAARVAQRLSGCGVDPATAEWDSARGERGDWTVLVTFPAGGRERQARWSFDVRARTVVAADDEARWLSEEDSGGTLPAPHLVTAPPRPNTVYDVEAEGGLSATTHARPGQPGADEPLDLMSAMRERAAHRGRTKRRKSAPSQTPLDEAPREDALPLEDIAFDPESMSPPPAARGTHPQDEPTVQEPAPEVGDDVLPKGGGQSDEQESGKEASEKEASEKEASGGKASGAKTSGATATGGKASDAQQSDGTQREDAPPDRPQRPTRKGGRRSVPSWDDVMFGAKPQD